MRWGSCSHSSLNTSFSAVLYLSPPHHTPQTDLYNCNKMSTPTASTTPTTTTPIRTDSLPEFDTKATGYVGMDVGGSLCKIVFYEPRDDPRIRELMEFLATSTTYGILTVDRWMSHAFCAASYPGSRRVYLCVWVCGCVSDLSSHVSVCVCDAVALGV